MPVNNSINAYLASAEAFIGQNAGNLTVTGINNVAFGPNALTNITSGTGNVAVGTGTLSATTTGFRNVAMGTSALHASDTSGCVALGYHALTVLTSGTDNFGLGVFSLSNLDTGSTNVCIGASTGTNYTTSESDNIIIGGNISGTAGESGVIRIGNSSSATKCIIQAISGKTSSGGAAVLVNASGVLGTTTSSIRFKEDVENMGSRSERLLQCRPVTFFYKEDEEKRRQYGMIAEEVFQVMPELVIEDEEGRPEAIRYEQMICMLVNEIIKLRERIEELESKVYT